MPSTIMLGITDSTMEIRILKLSELEAAFELIEEFDRVQSAKPTTDRLKIIYKQLQHTNSCILGAFVMNKLIGTCTLNICPNLSWSGRSYGIIENVIVTIEMRNKGIGKQLLSKAAEIAESLDCYKVALMTGSARKETHHFYESAGFKGNKTGFQIRFNA